MTVPEARPHAARILHCADCGGPLGAEATQCEYCGGVLDPNERHYTQMCPTCFARLPEKARFCIECATPIRPQELVSREASARRCPRDGEPLQARGAQGIPYEECPRCLGIWLDSAAFRDLCQRKTTEFEKNPLPDTRVTVSAALEPVAYLKCPVCSQLMSRQNFGRRSGVIIDQCAVHGVWLDDRELERVARFIAEGGLARARQADAERAEAESRRAARLAAPDLRGWPDAEPGDTGFLGLLSWFFKAG